MAEVGSGSSPSKTIVMPEAYAASCPSIVDRTNWIGTETYPDAFQIISRTGGTLGVRRTDSASSWGMNLRFECCLNGQALNAAVPFRYGYVFCSRRDQPVVEVCHQNEEYDGKCIMADAAIQSTAAIQSGVACSDTSQKICPARDLTASSFQECKALCQNIPSCKFGVYFEGSSGNWNGQAVAARTCKLVSTVAANKNSYETCGDACTTFAKQFISSCEDDALQSDPQKCCAAKDNAGGGQCIPSTDANGNKRCTSTRDFQCNIGQQQYMQTCTPWYDAVPMPFKLNEEDTVWGEYVSDETSSQSSALVVGGSPSNSFLVTGASCKEHLCDDVRLRHARSSSSQGSRVSEIFQADTKEVVVTVGTVGCDSVKFCPPNYGVVGIHCSGDSCGTVSLRCAQLKREVQFDTRIRAAHVMSEESGEDGVRCPGTNTFVTGWKCAGSNCDDMTLFCQELVFTVRQSSGVASVSFTQMEGHWQWQGQGIQSQTFAAGADWSKSSGTTKEQGQSSSFTDTYSREISTGYENMLGGEVSFVLGFEQSNTKETSRSVAEMQEESKGGTTSIETTSPDCSFGNLWQYVITASGPDGALAEFTSKSFVCIPSSLGSKEKVQPKCPPGHCGKSTPSAAKDFTGTNAAAVMASFSDPFEGDTDCQCCTDLDWISNASPGAADTPQDCALVPTSAYYDPYAEPRPGPPCPAGWYQNGQICYQGCPSNSQTRDDSSGRCRCGDETGHNKACAPNFECVKGLCGEPASSS
eukprot:SAG11_NODE_1470_length_4847_cov_2.253791_2_plen_754_part_00